MSRAWNSADIAVYCFIICIAMVMLAVTLQYAKAGDRKRQVIMLAVSHTSCSACHHADPVPQTYKQYRKKLRHRISRGGDQARLLADLEAAQ